MVHLLPYIPERRGSGFDTIEDVIPLYNLRLAFRTEAAPRRVYLAPQEREPPFAYEGGSVRVTVPELRGHQLAAEE